MIGEITLYGLKNCDSCKKALKALRASTLDVTFIDIRAEADLAALLPIWLDQIEPSKLVNTRSTTWRDLDEAARHKAGTNLQSLVETHPTLIKRPVIEANGRIYIGWTQDTINQLGL